MRYTVSADANDELGAILGYIATDSPNAAARVARRLRETFVLLSEHPNLGVRTDRHPTAREFAVRNLPYVIVHESAADGGVDILHVWDARRARPDTWT